MWRKALCVAMNALKVCQVCGDRATGFNYGGLSCESCKVFFCRHSRRQLHCVNTLRCVIDQKNRKHCGKCRLDKCFAIGMRQIVGDTVKCRQSHSTTDFCGQAEQIIEICIRRTFTRFDQAQLKYQIVKTVNTGRKPRVELRLTMYETEQIAQLRQQFAIDMGETRAQLVAVFDDPRDTEVMEIVNEANIVYMNTIATLCPRIAAFNTLTALDQMVVFKSLCYNVMLLRSAFLFDEQRNGMALAFDQGQKSVFIDFVKLFVTYDDQEVIQQNLHWLIELKRSLDGDETILDILLALSLFNCYSTISREDIFRYHFVHCCQLLRRYLHHKYQNVQRATEKYRSLMSVFDTTAKIKHNERQIYIKLLGKSKNPTRVPQVFLELYDVA